jgi:hypothetical protein
MGPGPGSSPPIPSWLRSLTAAGDQSPKALSAASHAAILAPGTAAGSLHAPGRTLQTRPVLVPCPEEPWQAPGSRTETRMLLQSRLPQVSSRRGRQAALSLLCPASRRAPVRGGGRRGRGGKDAGAGWGVVGRRGRSRSARPRRYLSPYNSATRRQH